MENVIESTNLTKIYSSKKALDNVSIHVPKGSIYGLIGRNGAGKTTFLKIVGGLATASSGSYRIFGKEENEIKSDRLKIGTLIEAPGIYPKLSAMENMMIKCLTIGIKDKKAAADILEITGLGNTGKKPAGKFSLGMKQRLGMALALIGNPEVVILDEPINGLDPEGIIEVRQMIEKLNRERNITFVISSHILEELSKIATHYGIINNGQLIEELDANELMSKCGDKILLGTEDNQKACQVLENMGITEFKTNDEGLISIKGQTDRISEINFAVAKENIPVYHLCKQSESLENYYIKLVGGKDGK